MNTPLHRLKAWVPVGITATLLSIMVYGAIQQYIRQSANDPQVQMAEDAAAKLATGTAPANLITGDTVDIAKSLAPFTIILDKDGNVLASSGSLEGETPIPPRGVLTTAQERGENRITWQPEAKVRAAIIVKYFNDAATGYVLVGRSLREAEHRTSSISLEIFLGWALTMLVTLFATLVFARHERHETKG